jgi:hypothetical protein
VNARLVLWVWIIVAFVGAIVRGAVGLTLFFVGALGFIGTNVASIVSSRRRHKQQP